MTSTRRDTATADWGQLFDVLSDEYRRRLLVALLNRDPGDEFRLPDDVPAGDTEPETLREALHHRHLPKLADRGFVEWRRESQTVARGPRFEAIRPFLDLVDAHRDELPDGWVEEPK